MHLLCIAAAIQHRLYLLELRIGRALQRNRSGRRSASCHAGSDDRLLRPSACAERHLDALESRSAADGNARCAGARGRSRALVRRPRRLGGDCADGRHLRLAALRAVVGAVLGAGAAPCPSGCRRGASPGVGLSAAARGLAAACRAGRDKRRHPVAVARAGTLCLGPRQRAGLLPDADFAAGQRLADVAGDPGARDAARRGAGRPRRDDRANGPARRLDRLRARAALSGASRKHGAVGAEPARRPATRRVC